MSADKKTTDRLLNFSCSALNTVSFRANQYMQVVQKKIDLGAIQKKIEQLHFELGKAVEEQYLAGQKDLLAGKEIARLLEKTSNLRQAAVLLEEEIDLIRNEPAQPQKTTPAEAKDDPPEDS